MVKDENASSTTEATTINLTDLENFTTQGLKELANIVDLTDLEQWKKAYLSNESAVVAARSKLPQLAKDLRAEYGKTINGFKVSLEQNYQEVLQKIIKTQEENKLATEVQDLTIPVKRNLLGAFHPINSLIQEVSAIFANIGWQIVEGPEVESTSYNFDALNFLPDHPSRSMQDTFHIADSQESLLLRTHTSPVQVRTLLSKKPPVYSISPGRVFRSDALDATHTPVFHQLEGLAVDENLTMADLVGVLDYLAKRLFNSDKTKVRLRPHFFPFTEPSAEVDVWFNNKKGGAGWVEWGGCGMVHPNVLLSAGVDPQQYGGFAFGMGLERTLQFRNGINDMHDIVEGDVRFSRFFGIG